MLPNSYLPFPSFHNTRDFAILVIFGEDVAFGGVFRCTVGLKDKYGKLDENSQHVYSKHGIDNVLFQ